MIDHEREVERRRQMREIKKIKGPPQEGRGAYLPGLWACRLAAGITQRELAERAGAGRTTIRSLEREDRRAHVTTIRRLSEALRVEPVDLLIGGVVSERN
jgi:DNA-binding XRE family transcriptional regulator